MLDFKSFRSAAKIIAGIETMHMVKKGQLGCPGGLAISPADFFCPVTAGHPCCDRTIDAVRTGCDERGS